MNYLAQWKILTVEVDSRRNLQYEEKMIRFGIENQMSLKLQMKLLGTFVSIGVTSSKLELCKCEFMSTYIGTFGIWYVDARSSREYRKFMHHRTELIRREQYLRTDVRNIKLVDWILVQRGRYVTIDGKPIASRNKSTCSTRLSST